MVLASGKRRWDDRYSQYSTSGLQSCVFCNLRYQINQVLREHCRGTAGNVHRLQETISVFLWGDLDQNHARPFTSALLTHSKEKASEASAKHAGVGSGLPFCAGVQFSHHSLRTIE